MNNKKQKEPKYSYRVWIEQVNQTWVDVKASDESEAKEKAYRKWRKEYFHSRVSYIEKQGS
tara:strand:- start:118 stop:300 length:183 start_codon:yes stop_codon:yes gene_type:complete